MRALRIAALLLCACGIGQAQETQDRLGGHIGFVLPLVTHAGGQTTTLDQNFGIELPFGVTIKGSGRVAFDFEFVPFVQDSPRNISLTVHPASCMVLGTASLSARARVRCQLLTIRIHTSVEQELAYWQLLQSRFR
jgi:hypothetical protein